MRRKFYNKQQKIDIPQTDVVVESVGVQGDGIARDNKGNLLFIPYALTGEELTVKPIKQRGDGYLAEIVCINKKSADRVVPFCNHFGKCGGCKLQHMNLAKQADLKVKNVLGAFKSQGIAVELAKPVQINSPRRRVRFNVIKTSNGYDLHFNKMQSNKVVKIQSCDILDRDLLLTAQQFIAVFEKFNAPTKLDMQVTKGDNGIEIVIYPFNNGDIDLSGREFITDKFNQLNLIGVYWYWDSFIQPICVKSALVVDFSGYKIAQPAAGFLQPSLQGQLTLVEIVENLLQKHQVKPKNKIADLFCGSGMFSYSLIKFGTVDSFEINPIAIAKINKNKALTPTISGYVRDLDSDPLSYTECNKYDVIVLDPARSGANNQALEIASSKCPLVIYISCNPIKLAKDSKTLLNGGYSIYDVIPVDQFIHTHHMEVITLFKK